MKLYSFKLRTFVSFEFELPTCANDSPPFGLPIATLVAESLRSSGFEVDGPDDREGWAWEFTCQVARYRIECVLGEVDDGPRQWLITTHPRRSLWDRLLGRSDLDQLTRYYEALDQIFKNDSRFRTVRWYTETNFYLDGGETWADAPCSTKDHSG